MQCVSCSRENPADARFCAGCGTALPMGREAACTLLGLETEASAEVTLNRYRELHRDTYQMLQHAPTALLKSRYENRLKELEEAAVSLGVQAGPAPESNLPSVSPVMVAEPITVKAAAISAPETDKPIEPPKPAVFSQQPEPQVAPFQVVPPPADQQPVSEDPAPALLAPTAIDFTSEMNPAESIAEPSAPESPTIGETDTATETEDTSPSSVLAKPRSLRPFLAATALFVVGLIVFPHLTAKTGSLIVDTIEPGKLYVDGKMKGYAVALVKNEYGRIKLGRHAVYIDYDVEGMPDSEPQSIEVVASSAAELQFADLSPSAIADKEEASRKEREATLQRQQAEQMARDAELQRQREKEASERALAAAQESARLANLRADRQVRVAAWKDKISNFNDTSYLRNYTFWNNNATASYLAIHYLDPFGTWVTEGWWRIEAFSSVTPAIKTNNRIVYIFVKNSDGTSYSMGAATLVDVHKWISVDKFASLDPDRLEGESDHDIVLFKRFESDKLPTSIGWGGVPVSQ